MTNIFRVLLELKDDIDLVFGLNDSWNWTFCSPCYLGEKFHSICFDSVCLFFRLPLSNKENKEIPSEEGLGIAKSPEGPKLDPHF